MKRTIVPVFILVMTVGAGCAKSNHDEESAMPTAPSALVSDSGASADVTASHPERAIDRPDFASLRGRIRDLNDRHTQFTLVLPTTDAQPEPRTVEVRIDERTDIIAGGKLVRRNVLQNGLECSVDGILRDAGHLLAKKITLARRPDRQ